MFLLRLLRKLGKLARGGVAPRQIILGAVLGVLIGMIPGFNLSVILLFLLLLLLNAHIGIALLGFAVGKPAMFLLAPITFRVGYFLIHSIGLEGFFRTLVNTPVLAFLDLQVYTLIGGIPFAIVLGLVFGILINRSVQALRQGIIEATERSVRMQRLAENKLIRLFMLIVFGRHKEDIQEMLQKKPSLFRKSGLGLAAGVLLIFLAVEFLLLDAIFASGVKKVLETMNGAEVNIAEADLSLAGGSMTLRGLQITDPANPEFNSFQVERMIANLSIRDLLRKRYVVDLLSVGNVRLNVPRESPGKVFEEPPEKKPVKEKTAVDYLERAQTIRDYLVKAQEYLEKIQERRMKEEAQEKTRKTRLFETAERRGYLGLSAKDLFARQPTWVIRRAEVEGMAIPGLENPQYIEGKNLSSHPELLAEAMALRMAEDPAAQPTGTLNFNFYDPGVPHEFALNLDNLSLSEGALLSEDAPVTVNQGEANFSLEGKFSSRKVDFPFTVALSNFQARVDENEQVLGMNPETANQVFESVDNFNMAGRVSGSLSSPRLEIDIEETVTSLKNALSRAGKQRLMEEADRQMERATERFKGEAQEKLQEQLRGLGGDQKNGEKETQKSPVDRFKDLF